jgi:hypothetical protein
VRLRGGVHMHDGFYLRFGLGAGFLAGSTVSQPGSGADVNITGGGIPLELSFGGTLPYGLVLGGGIYGMSVPSPSYSANGAPFTGGAAVVSSIGPFLDWYIDPTKGLHAQASIGYAAVNAARGNPMNVRGMTVTFPANDEKGNGFSLLLGGGYEWWVADQLSLGLLARVQFVSASVAASGDTTSSSVKTWIPALLATLTYQ